VSHRTPGSSTRSVHRPTQIQQAGGRHRSSRPEADTKSAGGVSHRTPGSSTRSGRRPTHDFFGDSCCVALRAAKRSGTSRRRLKSGANYWSPKIFFVAIGSAIAAHRTDPRSSVRLIRLLPCVGRRSKRGEMGGTILGGGSLRVMDPRDLRLFRFGGRSRSDECVAGTDFESCIARKCRFPRNRRI